MEKKKKKTHTPSPPPLELAATATLSGSSRGHFRGHFRRKLFSPPTRPVRFHVSTCTSRSLLLPLQSPFFMASQPPVTAGATGTAAASIQDIFDSSLNLEETHFNDGFTEGYNAGLISGKEEAKQVGLKFGFQVGEELGFYRGCVDVWNSAIEVDSTRFSSRVQKSIKQMEELLQKYPFFDPDDESAQEIMDNLRLKFRAICATLSVKLEYNGFLKSSSEAKDIEF